MKVFTVGMDEKPPIKDNPPTPDGVSLAPTPVITLEKKRSSYKSYLMCLGTMFFILLFAIIISELAYNRARDESYLRLRWAELKHRMGMGCDDCMGARMAQAFYPQRFQGGPIVLESSNEAAVPAAAAAVQEQKPQTTEQTTTSKVAPQPSEEQLSPILPQPVDSRLDFLRKIIPKIKEQAEKSGIEGVMQVKVLQIDPVEPKQPVSLPDGFGEIQQPQPAINMPQPVDFMAASRPVFGGPLADLLRWNAIDNDDSRTPPVNPFFGPQNDMMMGEPMLIMGPFIQPPLPQQPWLGTWDNNMGWNSAVQPRPFGWTQQTPKQQQWNNFWQWPNPANNNNNNQWPGNQWSSNQQQPVPVVQQQNPQDPPQPPPQQQRQQQQNPVSTWQTGNQWQNGVQAGGSWQNGVPNGVSNQWPQQGWQGQQQQQQQWSQYPQTWQASMNQNQNQNSNDWSIQRVTDSEQSPTVASAMSTLDSIRKLVGIFLTNRLSHLFQQKFSQQQQQANIVDNLDGRMSQAVLPSDNLNNNNNNYNEQWMRYYSQWYANNQRLQQQQPIATAAVSQSLEVTGPEVPPAAQEQDIGQQQQQQEQQQQQSQMMDSQQSQTIPEAQVQPLADQVQEQQQQQPQLPAQPSQTIQQFPDQPIQPQISAETVADGMPSLPFQQSPIIPVAQNGPDQTMPQAPAPFVFDSDDWKRIENSNAAVEPINDDQQQEQQKQQPQIQPQLPIHPIEGGSSGVSAGMKVIDDGPLKDTSGEKAFQQSAPTNDAGNGPSNPILFQVDEPPQQSVSMEEGFAK